MHSHKTLNSGLDYVGREMGLGPSFLAGVDNGRGSMVLKLATVVIAS